MAHSNQHSVCDGMCEIGMEYRQEAVAESMEKWRTAVSIGVTVIIYSKYE